VYSPIFKTVIVRKYMSDRKKSLGILLAGIGIFFLGISALMFAFKGCAKRQKTPEEIMAEAEEFLNGPQMKAIMEDAKKHPDKYAGEAKVIDVRTEPVK
jgi:hypothetical protein